MKNSLFSIVLIILSCVSCTVSNEVFKDELSIKQSTDNDIRFHNYYRNDSLDFVFSYFALQKFNISPSKKDISKSFLPSKWLKYIQKDKTEILYYTKNRDWNDAFIGVAYKTQNVVLYDYSLGILKKSKECSSLEKDTLHRSLKYLWTEKDSSFLVEEFYRTYKNVSCKFIFFEKYSKNTSKSDFFALEDYFGNKEVMKTFQDSVKYKIFQLGKQSSFSLMNKVFFNSNFNYLRPFFWYEKFKKEVKPNTVVSEAAALRTFYAFIGDYKKSITDVDADKRESLNKIKVDTTELQDYQAVDAVNAILEKSKDRQLVILNEHHQNSKTRFFAQKLLKGLYEQGFRHLSLETIYNDSLPNFLKYPTQKIGFYSADPMFGNFIRSALAIGFEIHTHENYDVPCNNEKDQVSRMNCREYNQALNLQKIYKKNPDAKVLAFVGHGHLLKKPKESGELLFAGQFQKLTGIDPLTIDQTVMREVFPTNDENPIYKYIEHKFSPKEPIVLKNNNSYWIMPKQRGDVDFLVFHNRSQYIDGHPEWMLKLGDKKIPIHLDSKKHQGCLLQVFLAQEQEDAMKYPTIPLLNVPLKEQNNFDIYLPSGKYYIQAVDYLGNTTYHTFKTL